MKKFLLFAVVTAFTSLHAQNNLVVFSENGDKFHLVINGVKQNLEPQTNVKVTDLIHPNYKVKIVFAEAGKGVVDQNVYLMDGGEPVKEHEFVYCVKLTGKGAYKIRPVSAVSISEVKADPAQTVVHYSTSEPTPQNNNVISSGASAGGISTNLHITETATQTQSGNNTSVGINMAGIGINVNVNDNMGGDFNHSSSTTVTGQTITSSTSSSGYESDNYQNQASSTSKVSNGGRTQSGSTGGCTSPMSSKNFNDVKSSISSKSFEDSKVKMAKQVIDANCLSTAQVKEIMLLFSFEATRLDLAKYAYGHTFDTNNYYKLNDAFTFESSIDELDAHIKTQKGQTR